MKKLLVIVPLVFLAACGNDNKPIVASASCSIDIPAAKARLPAAQKFIVSGWAFDKATSAVSKHVRVQITSTNPTVSKTFDAAVNVKRPDVATAFKEPKVGASGFSVEVPANSFAPGVYEITVLQEFPNTVLTCGTGHTIRVE